MLLLPAEQRQLEAKGWEPQRIADLKAIIAMREERDLSPIRREEIVRHLTAASRSASSGMVMSGAASTQRISSARYCASLPAPDGRP